MRTWMQTRRTRLPLRMPAAGRGLGRGLGACCGGVGALCSGAHDGAGAYEAACSQVLAAPICLGSRGPPAIGLARAGSAPGAGAALRA